LGGGIVGLMYASFKYRLFFIFLKLTLAVDRFRMANVKNYFKIGCVLGFVVARYFYIPRNLSCAEQIMNQELSERIIERGFEKYLQEHQQQEDSFENVKEALVESKMFKREEIENLNKAELLKKLKKDSKKNKKHFLYF
jgi:hypothetical protein